MPGLPTPPSVPLAAIRQPAFLYDAGGRVVEANDRLESLAGRSLAGCSVADVQAVFGMRPPGGAPYPLAELPVSRALRGEEAVDVPLAVTAPDGRVLRVLATASPIRDGGAVAGALVVWQDVTDLAAAGEALRESERRQAFLLALGDRLREPSAIGELTAAAAEMVGRQLGANGTVYCEVAGAGECATVRADWTDGTVPSAAGRFRMDDFGIGELYRRGGVRRTTDVTTALDGGAVEEHCALRIRSSLGVPVMRDGTLSAVLAVHSSRPRDWTDAEVELVREAGDRIWSAVERAKADEALQESEAAYRAFFDSRAFGTVEIDGSRRLTRVNDCYCRMTGYSREELLGMELGDLLPEDGREADRRLFDAYFSGGEVYDVEKRYVRKDGRVIWVHVTAGLVRDADGTPLRSTATVQEITDRKRAEAALETERARLQTVIDGMIDAYYVYDRDWRFVEINQRAADYFGLPREELLGRNVWELFPQTVGGYTWTRFQQAVAGGAPVRFETQSGVNEKSFEVYAYPRPEGLAVYLREITELRRAEARQAFLLQLSDALRPLADPLAVQGEAARLLGGYLDVARVAYGEVTDDGLSIAFARNYVAPGVPMVTGSFRKAEFGPALLAALREGRTIVVPDVARAAELPEAGRAGYATLGIASLVGVPLVKDGRFVAELAVHHTEPRDWSAEEVALIEETAQRTWAAVEQARAEAALREYAENLARSNDDLQRFAYVSSHDLQEPLRSIVSFSQLLERRYRGKLDADADEYIGFIVEGGNRMQSLIQDLLAYSRVNTTRQQIARTDTEDVLAEVVRNLDAVLREADVTLTHDPLPVVMADPTQLAQVFANLISNAVKFRRPDEPLRIHIGVRRLDGFCEFSVADNGIGIDPEYFEKIFVIFQRLHTRDQYEGTGIGLAIVKRIVDRHGGSIRIKSRPGRGSTFFFTLPSA